MKKLRTGVMTFALVAGLAAAAILVLPQPAAADMCVLDPAPFQYIGAACQPEPGTPQSKKFDYVRLYLCLGHYDSAGTPCECTYLGCVKDPNQKPANKPDV